MFDGVLPDFARRDAEIILGSCQCAGVKTAFTNVS